MRKITQSSNSEFKLIDTISNLFCDIKLEGVLGIGDDAAIIPCGEDFIVISTDMLVEDVHFVRKSTSAKDLGAKSLLVNISDIAAMGIKPLFSLLSVSLPKGVQQEWILEFMEGYHEVSKEFGIMLIGGDTTGSSGKVVINVVAIGRGEEAHIKKRSDAKVGDKIYVSGILGQSATGLQDILNGEYDTYNAKIHKRPKVGVVQGQWLGSQSSVNAMMDISDGIASDLEHILRSSDVGADLYLDKIPCVTTLKDAVCGGEDYKLLLTVSSEFADTIEEDYYNEFGERLYCIGEIIEGNSIVWNDNGKKIDLNWSGFRHF